MIKLPPSLQQLVTPRLETLRLRLADPEALIPLLILGLISGAVAGLSMVIFRLVIEASPALLLGAENPEDHEHMAVWSRLLLPTLGGLAVGLLLQRLEPARRQVGVVHVLERLSYSEGHLPPSNAGVQFVGAALCILSGHSIGREGPSIHIGAASGSWMGQRLHLPNNSIRILVGCGAAGAIAAAFNTPLAGVIFAMEVVLMEYTLSGFLPIIAAAVAATTVSRWAFGQDPVFIAPDVGLESLTDLGWVLVMGVLIGALSAAFFRLLVMTTRQFRTIPIWLRATLAGASTGILALWAPQVMGIGYDTVNQALLGELGLGLLLGILAAKLAATSLALGLGLPGGLIGPTLMMGAMAGGAVGLLLDLYAPADTSPALYAMLGMGAMMGATLNAPLAALTALLELTNNPHVIMPGMLAVVAASVTAHRGFGTASIFLKLMRERGLHYDDSPVVQHLRRLGVVGSMDRKVIQLPRRRMTRKALAQTLEAPSSWLLVRDPQTPRILFSAEVIQHLDDEWSEGGDPQGELDLYELPVHRLNLAPISAQATLLGALQRMDREQVDALYVIPPRGGRILGIITRKDIERSYRYGAN